MPLSKDANRVPLQIFAPNDIYDAPTVVDCNELTAIMVTEDTNFSLVSGGPSIPLKAGDCIGVAHLAECHIDPAQTIGVMERRA